MSQVSVSRLRRKPSLVKGQEESATQRAERKRYVRSMMEERAIKFDETALTESVLGENNKPLTEKIDGRNVPVRRPLSQAYELARSIEVSTHGWGLGKKFPITKENIMAFKKLVNLATLYEQDLGPDHPATKWLLGKLQNHALTLWPRGNTYDAKEIDMVEAQPSMDVMMQELSKRMGLGLPIATDLAKQQQQEAEET